MHDHHHHHDTDSLSDKRLIVAISINLLLSVIELIAGILAGSLSLIADAAHNFNDCMSLVVTLVARMISRKEADRYRTFGYRRAEVIGAFINLMLLLMVGIYLFAEAIGRLFHPVEIESGYMIAAATVALIIDLGTVFILLDMRKGSINLRAGFLHKLSDAAASVAVIIGGILIWAYQWYLVDLILSVMIASYISWQSILMLRPTIAILMQSVPNDIDIEKLIARLRMTEGVEDVHHVHVWELDEHHRALEAHVLIARNEIALMESSKHQLKRKLLEEFQIQHSTLEFEFPDSISAEDDIEH